MADIDVAQPRSRRTVLLAALGGVAASVAAALGRPAPAEATTGTMMYGDLNDAGTSLTSLVASRSGSTLTVTNIGTGHALQGVATDVASIGVFGQSTVGYGVLGDISTVTDGGYAGTWGRDFSLNTRAVGAAGSSAGGTGVTGVAGTGVNDAPPPIALGSNGLTEVTGVYGFAASGVGVRASSTNGTALKVTGKASFSRSGKVNFPANATYLDITPPGGLTGTPLCFANLLEFRPSVYVAAVRPNWPTTGKMRIYLNKAASTTAITPLAWMVMG